MEEELLPEPNSIHFANLVCPWINSTNPAKGSAASHGGGAELSRETDIIYNYNPPGNIGSKKLYLFFAVYVVVIPLLLVLFVHVRKKFDTRDDHTSRVITMLFNLMCSVRMTHFTAADLEPPEHLLLCLSSIEARSKST